MREQGKPLKFGRVLVVDDHAAARESVADVLRHAGYLVTGASSAREGLGLLAKSEYQVIITDLQMPGMDGLEFIRQIQQQRLLAQIIMVTAHATIGSAVEAMRHGAFDYLEKPFNATRLEELVGRALERGRLLAPEENNRHSGSLHEDEVFGLVGNSQAMQELRASIRQVAPTDETVLIVGESGTGKELVARALHRLSKRSSGPLVSLNCPALSPQLTESELFGHRRGAFTGAEDDRQGRFEMADKGTILLDEITEIDLGLQAKLLRVLQERTFERVGCSQPRSANVRVLASTNRDLQQEVASARFRQDLYYRLAVVPLVLPPLREREADVHMLTDYFLDRAAIRLGRQRCQMEQEARRLFGNYHWPGNVRELENIVTRACVLNEGQPISAVELQPWLEQPECVTEAHISALPVGVTLEEMERQMIVATLEHFDGHRARTAEALGIGVRTLSGKLRGYGYAPHTKEFGEASDVRQNLPSGSASSANLIAKLTA
ncbi:sigma-54-dependent transcriptional regulator [Bythopirellula goksoeyrii]|uniref:Transcriptional regulatory protein ZraR n=1 Tax=Bythopirellula goksoeyrii TaxID=1400387 RepID=A0A5B9Q5P3_9BACT|nr:sigma-54 dependent transcriptional regulator [Bythopirellula goksoeyrii]QEG33060.1 Transcriptional regulatory protein ZraR [Bythopirellula goksoeyrii]